MADRAASGAEALLAQAILELSGEVRRLRSRVRDTNPLETPATVTDLSGSGCRILTPLVLAHRDWIEIRFEE